MKHENSLDGWRGVAILLVFCFHYLPHVPHGWAGLLINGCWMGVDLFFVLSGFLITGILCEMPRSRGFFCSFYARRSLRLFPLYLAAVAVVIVASHGLAGHRSWKEIPFFVYGANIMPKRYGWFPPYVIADHFWSLALEEQFYSVWPVVVFFVRDAHKLMRVCMAGIGFALLLRIVLVWQGADPDFVYRLLPTRMDALLIGGLAAVLLRHSSLLLSTRRLYWVSGTAALAIMVCGVAGHGFSWSTRPMMTVGYTAVAVFAGSILVMAVRQGSLAHALGKLPLLRFFGRYSYGLYVWHFLPCLAVFGWLPRVQAIIHPQALANALYFVSVLALFTVIAMFSFHCFENPFLRLKSRFPPPGPGVRNA